MKRGLSNVLSLVIGQRSIVLAQVAAGKPAAVAKRVGVFLLDDASWIDKPADSGKSMRGFLDSHDFDSANAVVGVPASWLLAQEKELPPADATAASAILRLAAERLSMAGSAPLVADYAGKPTASSGSKVLLVGMLRAQFEKIEKFCEAAGLKLQAVCPTSLGALKTLAGEGSLLRLSEGAAELVTQDAGVPSMIRPITGAAPQLAAELKRTLVMRPGGGGPLAIAGDVGQNPVDRVALAERIGGASRVVDEASCPQIGFDTAAMNGASVGMTRAAALPAVALGVAAIDNALPIDFSDSKLTEIPPRRFGRRSVWAVAVAAVAIIGLISLEWTVESREVEADELAKKVADASPTLKTAKAAVDKFEFGRPYFATHPPQLDCLKSLTLAFNYTEPIWADNIQLRDNGVGQLSGKSSNQPLITALFDRMRAQPLLTNVLPGEQRNDTGKDKDISYSITFTFAPCALTPAASNSAAAKTAAGIPTTQATPAAGVSK